MSDLAMDFDPRAFLVWLQGGPGDGVRASVRPEPPDEITYMPDLDDETVYVRVPEVEQFAHERIYYPKDGRMAVDEFKSEHRNALGDDYRMATGGDEGEKRAQTMALGRTISTIHQAMSRDTESVIIEFVDGHALAVDALDDRPGVTRTRWLTPEQVEEATGW